MSSGDPQREQGGGGQEREKADGNQIALIRKVWSNLVLVWDTCFALAGSHGNQLGRFRHFL